MQTKTPGPGRNVAVLRKARDMSQEKLARRAGVSTSLLSKIEVGDRALSQGVAAALAAGMGITLDELLGKAPVEPDEEERLQELGRVIRRFDLPGEPPAAPESLKFELAEVFRLRGEADLLAVMHALPGLLSRAQNQAHATGRPKDWQAVADVYSAVYWLAARHRWMHLAELAVMKQARAAERSTPLMAAIAARDEAGTFLNGGDFHGGLAVVDQAIVQAETDLTGRDKAFGLGLLHLRGLTLAGRLKDRNQAKRHKKAAWRVAEQFHADVNDHGIHFGPENTAIHVISTDVDLEENRGALETAESLLREGTMLPATRIGPLHMNVARARLALHDREGALDSLHDAWEAAPQMARVHPTSQELLRVLTSLHKRSNPRLTRLARKAGFTI
ncbi:helix-turn-helix domain-containing protein [Streptomyces sp. 8N706]|uniref:helix-turn-helix domain-containing protein n=1 Tax=Streptomyces sp. 8N706 TaxID=3457416 RepID=UPI003FD103D5